MKKILKSRAFTVFCIGFLLYLLLMTPELIKYGGIVLNSSDYIFSLIPLKYHAHDAILSGNLNWDWTSGFGSQFISSYLQTVASPFLLLTLPVPRELLIYAATFTNAMKFGFGSLWAYFYIARFVRGRHFAAVGGVIYMFSTFTGYDQIFYFNDIIAFFPLMLIALEELCINKRRGFFALIVMQMAAASIYFLFGQAVFCVIYYLIRCTDKEFGANIRQFLSVAAEAVIGVGLSSALFLPCLLYLFDQPRATEIISFGEMFFYHDIFHYLKIIQGAFMIPDPMQYTSLFPETEQMYPFGISQSSTAAFIPLFGASGVISWVLARKKTWQTRLIVIFPVMIMVPVLNSLFSALNGAFYTRWLYMPILIASMISVKALEEEISFKPGLIVNGAALLFFLIYHLFLAPYGFAAADENYAVPENILDPKRLFDSYGLFNLQIIFIPVLSLLLVLRLSKAKRDKSFFPKLYAAAGVSVCLSFGIYSFYHMTVSGLEGNPYIS